MHVIGLSTWCGYYELEQRRKQHFWLWRFKPQNTKLPPRVQISSLISLQLNYINLKGKKRITYLQEIQINNQKCKLPLLRASHCLPTSRFVTEIIKKTKKIQKDEKKELLKASNTGQGAEQLPSVATLCATQTEQLRLFSHNPGEAESAGSTWKSSGPRDAPGSSAYKPPLGRIPLVEHTWDIPALWHMGYSSFVSLCCWRSPLWDGELMGARCFMLTPGVEAPSTRTSRVVAGSSQSVWLDKVVIIGSTAATAWQTQPLCALNHILVVLLPINILCICDIGGGCHSFVTHLPFPVTGE